MWPNPLFPADLVKFTEEILNGKRYFLCIMKRKYFCPLKYLNKPLKMTLSNTLAQIASKENGQYFLN